MSELVLVTGASGFVAIHCVAQLLEAGYKVRGTVRSLSNDQKVQPIKDVAGPHLDRLELVEADLLNPESWKPVIEGVDFVLHVASPFTVKKVLDEQELIRPAVDGTLNVLKAVATAEKKPKRVVLTSSVAAIQPGNKLVKGVSRIFTESDWQDPTGSDVTPYFKSKYLAEKSAWDFVDNLDDPQKFELTVLNPSFVIGPFIHSADATSAEVITRFMNGSQPLHPRIVLPNIDVRDLARAHINAMKAPEAAGKRIIVSHSYVPWFREVGAALANEFRPQGYKIAKHEAPYPLLWLTSFWDEMVEGILPMVGFTYGYNNDRMKTILKIENPIAMEKSLIDMGYSLIEKGFLEKTDKYKGPPNQN